MIADLSLTESQPARDALCLALIDLQHHRRRWRMLKHAIPFIASWIERRAVKAKDRHWF
jgi:hypothetical protein